VRRIHSGNLQRRCLAEECERLPRLASSYMQPGRSVRAACFVRGDAMPGRLRGLHWLPVWLRRNAHVRGPQVFLWPPLTSLRFGRRLSSRFPLVAPPVAQAEHKRQPRVREYLFIGANNRPSNGLPISCGTAARIGLSMILRCPCGGTVSLIGWLGAGLSKPFLRRTTRDHNSVGRLN